MTHASDIPYEMLNPGNQCSVAFDRPILITGTPRSGKSILREIITAAEEFLCIEEPLLVWHGGEMARHDDRRTETDVTPALRERIRSDCERTLARSGRRRYLDDLSYHAICIPYVREIMPEARIIHITREPEATIPELIYGWTYRDAVRDMVARRWRSLRLRGLPHAAFRFALNYYTSRIRGRRATWGPVTPGLREFAKHHSVPEVAAYQWRSLTDICLDDLAACPSDLTLQIRYENLLLQPQTELERIVEFNEPENPEAVMERGIEAVDPNFTWDRKVDPAPEEWEAIEPIIAPTRERLAELIPPLPQDPPAGESS